jgi:hypothetical protein
MDMFRRRFCFGDAKESNYTKRTIGRTLMTVSTPLSFERERWHGCGYRDYAVSRAGQDIVGKGPPRGGIEISALMARNKIKYQM